MTDTPARALTDTRNPETGQLDAQLTAQVLGLTLPELGWMLNHDLESLAKHPSSDHLQPALQPLAELTLHLREVLGTLELARTWLRASNPVLSGEAPVTSLLRGDMTTITKLLRMAESGMPT